MEARGGRSSDEDGRPAAPRRATGRLVESTQAEDRRLIALVGARPLLYARSTLPVASYYSQVKQLWQEVADLMGWTVAEVRRKWSHIRNSYSRHLRNEIHGLRTGRGRMVSRWYLADDLEFLRHHMATDTRPSAGYSMVSVAPFAPALLKMEVAAEEPAAPWYAAPEPAREDSATSFEADETADYFHFFRGLYADYQELAPPAQRKFRRQCLLLLHELVDGAGDAAGGSTDAAEGCTEGSAEGARIGVDSSDSEMEQKCFVPKLVAVNGAPASLAGPGGPGGESGEGGAGS